MAYSIRLCYPTEQAGSLFSHLLGSPVQAPSLLNILCKVVGGVLHGVPGLLFCTQRDTVLSIQSTRVLNYSLEMCPSLLSLDYSSNSA